MTDQLISNQLAMISNFSWQLLTKNPMLLGQEPVSCESGHWNFEKWKVKWKSGSLISRMKSEMKKPCDREREWKVKWKWLKIEIENEKWNENASRSRSRSEISREFSRNSRESRNVLDFDPSSFHLANFSSFYVYLKKYVNKSCKGQVFTLHICTYSPIYEISSACQENLFKVNL